MASYKLRISLPTYLVEMSELEKADNKSGRIQELITKGLMAEREKKNPPSRIWTGAYDATDFEKALYAQATA